MQPRERRLDRTAEQPVHHSEREEVLAAQDILLAQGGAGQRLDRALIDVFLDDAESRQSAVGQRIGLAVGALEILVRERPRVDQYDAARLKVLVVDDQRGGVHRHQHVGRIARRVDVSGTEVDLEARHAGACAGRRADFRREVGERGQVVAHARGGVGELRAGQLHAVAGVAGKTDGDVILTGDLAVVGRHEVASPPRPGNLRGQRAGTGRSGPVEVRPEGRTQAGFGPAHPGGRPGTGNVRSNL